MEEQIGKQANENEEWKGRKRNEICFSQQENQISKAHWHRSQLYFIEVRPEKSCVLFGMIEQILSYERKEEKTQNEIFYSQVLFGLIKFVDWNTYHYHI